MSGFSDDDIFEFDDRMDTELITLGDSDNSFDEGPKMQMQSSSFDKKSIIEKYENLKKESKRLDELAVEVRSLVMICKQMEECYTKRIGLNLAGYGEVRYLHDGTVIILITIHNITNQPLNNWILSVRPSPIFPDSTQSASICQTIALDSLPPGTKKTYQTHLNCEEPPFLLQLSLVREFQLGEVRKIFQVDIDPVSVTCWNQAQTVQKKNTEVNANFSTSIRLPNSLINLLSGSPDTIVSIPQVFKAVFNVSDVQDDTIVMYIPFSATENIFVKANCVKDGTTHQTLTIGTESSRSHALLTQHLRLHLIVEMSKLKSRPAKEILMLTEMDAVSVEELFQSMLGAFN